MEWSKEKLEGTCVLIKSVSQSNRILKFYQSFGYFEQTKQNWKCPESMVGSFIGLSRLHQNDIVHIYWRNPASGMQTIELPVATRRKFPREMMVSMNGKEWMKAVVLGKIKHELYPFIIKDEANFDFSFHGWKYAKEIDDRTAS